MNIEIVDGNGKEYNFNNSDKYILFAEKGVNATECVVMVKGDTRFIVHVLGTLFKYVAGKIGEENTQQIIDDYIKRGEDIKIESDKYDGYIVGIDGGVTS